MKVIVLLFATTALCTVGCGSDWEQKTNTKILPNVGENIQQTPIEIHIHQTNETTNEPTNETTNEPTNEDK